MPLTPRFELNQTPREVIITVFVPTVRITNLEVLLEEDSTLHFFASPYLLKLNFAPHEFAAEAHGIVSVRYDPSAQTITIPLMKSIPAIEWPNLELTARLMQPQEIPRQWLHSVAEETTTSKIFDKNTSQDVRKNQCENDEVDSLTHRFFGYGFGNIFQNIFTDYCRSGLAQEMLQLAANPETTSSEERRRLRIEKESNDFDSDRYLGDYDLQNQDDYMYPIVMDFVPFWKLAEEDHELSDSRATKSVVATAALSENLADADLADHLRQQLRLDPRNKSTPKPPTFTSDEQLQLSTIPYPLIPKSLLQSNDPISDDANCLRLWCGLLDLLVPYVYDHITTMGEPTVESAWTITTLSSSLSFLDPPETLQECLISSSRRMLIYPYWRNFDFVMDVIWNHTLCILKGGTIYTIIKCLLQVRTILERSESYYIGNKLFVDPYLYWIQHQPQSDNYTTQWRTIIRVLEQELSPSNRGELKARLGLDLARCENMLIGQENDSSSKCSDDESVFDTDSEESCSSDEESEESENYKNQQRDKDDLKSNGGLQNDEDLLKTLQNGALIPVKSMDSSGKVDNISTSLLDFEVDDGNRDASPMLKFVNRNPEEIPQTTAGTREIHGKRAPRQEGIASPVNKTRLLIEEME